MQRLSDVRIFHQTTGAEFREKEKKINMENNICYIYTARLAAMSYQATIAAHMSKYDSKEANQFNHQNRLIP